MTEYFKRPKDPGETIELTFDFADAIGDANIVSFDPVTVSVYRGTDAGASTTLSGAATRVNEEVFQSMIGGLANVDYKFRAAATTDDVPARKVVIAIIVAVRDA
jgi:hypothetical protein